MGDDAAFIELLEMRQGRIRDVHRDMQARLHQFFELTNIYTGFQVTLLMNNPTIWWVSFFIALFAALQYTMLLWKTFGNYMEEKRDLHVMCHDYNQLLGHRRQDLVGPGGRVVEFVPYADADFENAHPWLLPYIWVAIPFTGFVLFCTFMQFNISK